MSCDFCTKVLQWAVCVATLVPTVFRAQATDMFPERVEKRVELTVPAVFLAFKYENWRFLVLSNKQHKYTVPWLADPRFKNVPVIQTNKIYTFTVVEEPSLTITVPVTNTIAPQVVRMREGDNVIYDLEQCEVHYAAMKRVELPIAYGLIVAGTNQPNRLVEQQLFPHRWKPLLGGCLVGLTSPKTRDGYLCDACQFDYSRWEEEHKPSN